LGFLAAFVVMFGERPVEFAEAFAAQFAAFPEEPADSALLVVRLLELPGSAPAQEAS